MKPVLIDAHQDIAYNILSFGRDVRRSVAETRRLEQDTRIPEMTGHALLGWPEYQKGRVALVIATIFVAPEKYKGAGWANLSYRNFSEARKIYHAQFDAYERLADESPDQFRLVKNRRDLAEILQPWDADTEALQPHPVGLVISMEGAEGIQHPEELEEYHAMGMRLVGPVWAGTRWCGGTCEPGGFTPEGDEFLERAADLGLTVDISHMTEISALHALERYEGLVIASHANARALLREDPHERQLTDRTLRALIERDGVVGVVPYNKFLKEGWRAGIDPAASQRSVPLEVLAAHIDHICQIAGDALHVGIGSDFDGGFGWPDVPDGVQDISDLQKLVQVLAVRGYQPQDIDRIFNGNWRRMLERTLPET